MIQLRIVYAMHESKHCEPFGRFRKRIIGDLMVMPSIEKLPTYLSGMVFNIFLTDGVSSRRD